MATIFSHGVCAAAIGSAFPPPKSARFWLAGIACSMIPDIDTLGFHFGIPYGSMFGHRGFTHSIAFAIVLSTVVTALIRRGEKPMRWGLPWLYLFLATMSHGLLDACTDGGKGVAFFAPFSNARYFFPWNPIRVSPIGQRFFSARGLTVLESELLWIWLPSIIFSIIMCAMWKFHSNRPRGSDL
jgi:inner membrane protein